MFRHSVSLLSISLCSCATGRAPLDPDDYQSDDTGSTDEADTDTDTDTDPGKQPDFSVWEGIRSFEYDSNYDSSDCEEDVFEDGVQLTSGNAYEAIQDECPDCDYIYEVDVGTDEICGWIGIDTETYRGLIIDGNHAEIWRFEMDRGDLETAYVLTEDADFDGWVLEYQYGGEYGDWGGMLYINGQVEFPLAE
jgi:hypothetical protein